MATHTNGLINQLLFVNEYACLIITGVITGTGNYNLNFASFFLLKLFLNTTQDFKVKTNLCNYL